MAVANTKATAITNLDADPIVRNDSSIHSGHVIECVGYVEVLAADDDTSVYRFCRVPSNARISSIQIMNDAITGGTDYDVGFHRTAADGGAVVDKDAFLDGSDFSSARADWTELMTAVAEENREKVIWELDPASLSADPQTQYDITITANTVGTAAGTVAVKVQYVL